MATSKSGRSSRSGRSGRKAATNVYLPPSDIWSHSLYLPTSKTSLPDIRVHFRAVASPNRPQLQSCISCASLCETTLGAGMDAGQLHRSTRKSQAETGARSRARRLSISTSENRLIQAEIVDLYSEFANQSLLIGKRGKYLGKGAASTVSLMCRKGSPDELFAVKRFRSKQKLEDEKEYKAKILSEFHIANSLHHPNIIQTIRLCSDKGSLNHVMEYCEAGDLFSLVQKQYLCRDDRAADRLCLFKQLIQGVRHLHQHGIAHRDIKLENLLINSQGKLKITDFGVSEVFTGSHPGTTFTQVECGESMGEVRLCEPGICGSMPYIAPEVLRRKEAYDPRALDVWSSAIVMLDMIFGGALWSKAEPGNRNYDALCEAWSKWEAKNGEGAKISPSNFPYVAFFHERITPPALRRVLLDMLHPNPTKRKTIEEVYTSRVVRNADCCQGDGFRKPQPATGSNMERHMDRFSTGLTLHNHLPPRKRNFRRSISSLLGGGV